MIWSVVARRKEKLRKGSYLVGEVTLWENLAGSVGRKLNDRGLRLSRAAVHRPQDA